MGGGRSLRFVRAGLLKLYDELFSDVAKELPELIFGTGLSKSERNDADRRLAILSGALSGIVLESHFRPSLLPPQQMKRMVGELFDAIIHH